MRLSNGAQAPKQEHDPSLHDLVLIDQLPSDMWAEGIAVRPSGDVFVARLDVPELYAVHAASAASPENEYDTITPKLAHTFPDAGGCFNITRLLGTDREEYAVTTGQTDLRNGEFHSWTLWRVTIARDDGSEEVETSKMLDIPDAQFLMGLVTLSDRVLAVADAKRGCIWRIDIVDKACSILFEDDAMYPPGEGNQGIFGINRAQFTKNFGWFINTGSGKFYRFPIQLDGENNVSVHGPVQEISENFEQADGLVVKKDGSAAYICSYTTGILWRVDMEGPEGSGDGKVKTLRRDLVSPTGMELVYQDEQNPTLYILCCGLVHNESLEGERGHWLGLANVDKSKLQIMVTVTTEVSYEYV